MHFLRSHFQIQGADQSFGFKRRLFFSKSLGVCPLPFRASSSHIPHVLLRGRSQTVGDSPRFWGLQAVSGMLSHGCSLPPSIVEKCKLSRLPWQGVQGWDVRVRMEGGENGGKGPLPPVSGFFFSPLGSFNPALSCLYLKSSLDSSPQAPPHPARPFTSPATCNCFSVSTPPYPEHRVPEGVWV